MSLTAVSLGFVPARLVPGWLSNGLHSLDFSLLLRRGIMWDGIVVMLSIVGFAFAVTSVVLGWCRVARTRRLAAQPH